MKLKFRFNSYLLCLLLAGFYACKTTAQMPGDAKKVFESAELTSSDDSAMILVQQAFALLKAKPKPDSALLGRCHFLRGRLYGSKEEYLLSWQDYSDAFMLLTKFDLSLAGYAMDSMNVAYSRIQLLDIAIPTRHLENPDWINEEKVFFSLMSVIDTSVAGDTIWASIWGGKNEGIYEGSTGGVLTAYNKDYPERGNNEFANCRVTELHNTWCRIEMTRFESAKSKGLFAMTGDNVMFRIKVPKSIYHGNLYDLAGSNVLFSYSDASKTPVYSHQFVFQQNTKETELYVNQYLAGLVKATAEWLYDTATMKGSESSPDLSSGMYKGLNYWEAMLQCGVEDIKAFHRFVKSYPAKYMGRGYRIDETYATWALNNTPPGDNEIDYAYERLLEETGDQNAIENLAQKLNYLLTYCDDATREKIEEKRGKGTYIMESIALDWVDKNYTRYADDSRMKEALVAVNKQIVFAKWFRNDSMLVPFYAYKASILNGLKKDDEALEYYNKALDLNIKYYLHLFQRALFFYRSERYKEALIDLDSVSADYSVRYPWYSDVYGMQGWILLKTGKFKQGYDYCKKAYETDSSKSSWIVNMGHAHLFMNEMSEARRLYEKTLENIDKVSSFFSGPLADFDLFIENGWQEQLVRQERQHMLSKWNEQFQYRVMADSLFQLGKKLVDSLNYSKAVVLFQNAIVTESKSKIVDEEWNRAYIRWTAYTYYKNKDYAQSLVHYKKSFDLTRKYLNNTEYEVMDLKDIANIYNLLGDSRNEAIYRQLHGALQRKLHEQEQSNKLFVVAIGGNNVSCEKDASEIVKVLADKSKLVYDKTFVFDLIGKNLSTEKLDSAFRSVIKESKPGDALVFYFAGNTGTAGNDKVLILNKDTLTVRELQYWSSNIQAKKQLFIWDIQNEGHTDAFLSVKNEFALTGKGGAADLVLICNKGSRIEGAEGGGLLTNAVIEAFSGKANTAFSENDRSVSAKELETYVFDKLGRKSYYLEVVTFSEGLDFPLVTAPLTLGTTDKNPPVVTVFSTQVQISRGADVTEIEEGIQINGQATDESGIAKILVNGTIVNHTQNGKFEYPLGETKPGEKLIVEAEDVAGNISRDTFLLSDLDHGTSREKAVTREVVNRALLFGINEYDEWSDLNNPVNDVRELGRLLKEYYGYEVTIVEDATRAEIREKMDSFIRLDYGPNDNLMVFFAGHGVRDQFYGGNIVCRDSKKNDKRMDSYISFFSLAADLDRQQNCRHVFLVLDVCFGGGIFDNNQALLYKGKDDGVDSIKREMMRLEQILKAKSRIYLTSGGDTFVADGRPGFHSPFAFRIIQALEDPLKNHKSYITLKDLVDYISDLPKEQQPRYGPFGDSDRNADVALKPIKYYEGFMKQVGSIKP
jgi:tetratricopeptide (TPR) repeat protein